MTCQEARGRFSEWVDEVLDGPDREDVAAHLVVCADCRREERKHLGGQRHRGEQYAQVEPGEKSLRLRLRIDRGLLDPSDPVSPASLDADETIGGLELRGDDTGCAVGCDPLDLDVLERRLCVSAGPEPQPGEDDANDRPCPSGW